MAAVSPENEGAPAAANKPSTQDNGQTSKDETQADSPVAKKKQALKKKVTPAVTKLDTETPETPSEDPKAKATLKRKAEKELEAVPKKKKKVTKDANEKDFVKTTAATGKRILKKKAGVPDKKTVADKSAADKNAAEGDVSISQPPTTRKEQIKLDETKGKQRALKKKVTVSKNKAVPVTTNQDDDDTDVEDEGEDTRTQIHVDDEITLNISDASLSHMKNMQTEESKSTGQNKATEKQPALKKTAMKKSVLRKNQENISTPGPSKAGPNEAGTAQVIKKKKKLGEAGDTGQPVTKKKKKRLVEVEDAGKPVVKKKKKLVGGGAAGRKGRSGANTRSVDLHL